jgi:hypothetical protein
MIVYNLGSLPDWIMSIAALIALIGVALAYREYSEKTRPYIDIELQTVINQTQWSFLTLISNKGQYPVYSKITNALLTIGDEKYPTIVNKELVVFPGEDKKTFVPVGNINAIGRKKIREAKYTKNVVELLVEVSSRKLNQKEYRYKTILRVQVLVEEEKPGFVLLEKTFI